MDVVASAVRAASAGGMVGIDDGLSCLNVGDKSVV